MAKIVIEFSTMCIFISSMGLLLLALQ